jgi:general secretion pathway protein J
MLKVKVRLEADMAAARPDNRGFTLLELLIAMTMMTVIAASLYASMSIGFKARESAERVVEKGRAAEIAVEAIKGMLMSAMVPSGVLAGSFTGEDGENDGGYSADTLSFYTADYNPKEDETACDIAKVELAMSVRENKKERVIARKVTTNLLSPATIDPDEEILCGNVRSMNLQYYDGSGWVDEWASSENDNALPRAVKITVELENADTSGTDDKDDDEEDLYTYTETITLPCSNT